MKSLCLPVAISLTFFQTPIQAHTRLECPPPRSGKTGEKVGPCDAPDDPLLPAYPLKPGAFNTITWLESIAHPGAPGRLALSLDGDDSLESFESCLLLDHIPHDEYSMPFFSDPQSWHRSSITIWIPDVYCERCHLQLITVMSDAAHGVPEDTTCAYEGALETGRVTNTDLPACPAVYHSCSPVSISGTVPRNDIEECNTAEFEEKLEWPMRPQDSSEGHFDYSSYYHRGDPGLYDLSSSRLMMTGSPIEGCDSFSFCDPGEHFDMMVTVPEDASYTAMEGTCAAIVTMEVEDFEMGVLPSVPRNMSDVTVTVDQDPCAMCALAKPCFFEACPLRDEITGNWTGLAAECSVGGPFCEVCFPDSPCYGFGSDGGEDAALIPSGNMEDEGDASADAPLPPLSGESTSDGGSKGSSDEGIEASSDKDIEASSGNTTSGFSKLVLVALGVVICLM
mmetsp:Transcript_14316/g.25153  ORF Transcript_14316/g.25153 Transcript_14316/m.25153 type:complete len:451 (+) Transcript_14316:153-1505(+)